MHNYQGSRCDDQRCREADGWQCAECGHYFPRSRVQDIGGEYYCRDGMGHDAPTPALYWPQHLGDDGKPCEFSGEPWDVGADSDRNGCSLYPTRDPASHV